MADNTKISWADATWSPITGCTPVSEGCEHCYAKRMANRLRGRFGYPQDDPFKVTFHPDRLGQPLKWRKPKRIFVCSMGDLFHEDVKHDWIRQVLINTLAYPQHTYLFLTKRAQRMKHIFIGYKDVLQKNNFCGITAENQQRADERIPILLQIPAAVRFVSLEPLLGPINLGEYIWKIPHIDKCRLDWVIVGGETGPGARPMNPDWARSVRDQCEAAEVPFFMKKMSGGKEPPKDLLIRKFPK